MKLSSLIGDKLELAEIPILNLVGDIAYINVYGLREKRRAHTLVRLDFSKIDKG